MQTKSIAETPTWRTIIGIIQNDADYPSGTRSFDIGRINKAIQWDAGRTWEGMRSPIKKPSSFLNRPLTCEAVDALFDGLNANELRVSQKTLDNAKIVCKRIASRYVVSPPMLSMPLSVDAERALAITTTIYERINLKRFLIFLSATNTSPWHVTDVIAKAFRQALGEIWRLNWADLAFRHAMQNWNRCAKRYPEFPQIQLTGHLKGPVQRSHKWVKTPGLEAKIDAYLACGVQYQPKLEQDTESLSDELDVALDHNEFLSAESIKSNKKALRMTVRVLRDDGVPFEHLLELRDLCQPARYRQAMKLFITLADGKVNSTVFMRGLYLMRLSRHPGVLSKEEVKLNAALFAKVRKKHKVFMKTYEDRDQRTLEQLDDPTVMDAFLALPTITKNKVLKSGKPYTIQDAYAIQCALILELWLCAPYRLTAFTNIEVDQFTWMQLAGEQCAMLRGPSKQSSGKRSPEHFLNEAAQELLALYLSDFLPLIRAKNKAVNSQALFPRTGGKPKSTQCMYDQIVRYVRKNTSLKEFHPHVIRKITPKITLDADPGALEVARRTGGWASTAMRKRLRSAGASRLTGALSGPAAVQTPERDTRRSGWTQAARL